MWVIYQWIKKNSYPLLAFSLFLFSFNQILQYQIYQHSFYFNTSISFIRSIDEWRTNFTSFVNLKTENEKLRNENLFLRNSISYSDSLIGLYDQIKGDTSYLDTLTSLGKTRKISYDYVSAKVIKNSTNRPDNYFYLDKGSVHGIKEQMAVMGPEGVVGVIIQTTKHYAVGMSVLNSKFETTPLLKRLGLREGVLKWNGSDSRIMNLDEISRTEKVKAGDLVLTSNYSSIFPPYQPIGKVKKVNTNTSSQFSEIEVELSTNFNKLNTVYCVSTRFKNEMDSLQNSPLISPVSSKSDKNR